MRFLEFALAVLVAVGATGLLLVSVAVDPDTTFGRAFPMLLMPIIGLVLVWSGVALSAFGPPDWDRPLFVWLLLIVGTVLMAFR